MEEPQDRDPDVSPVLRRWVLGYPVVALAVALAVWILSPRREAADAPAPVAGLVDTGPAQPSLAPDRVALSEQADHPSLLGRGRASARELEQRALRVADGFGHRLGDAARSVGERVEVEDIERGGAKVARLAPYVGPYLRYHRARGLYRSGDPELQAAAKRQTVLALAEMALDVSAGALGHAGSGSADLLDALEGAVDLADFAGFALSLNEELGDSLRVQRLSELDQRLEVLAGLALAEIEGLDLFVARLLEVEPGEWRDDLPPDVVERAESLLEAFRPAGWLDW